MLSLRRRALSAVIATTALLAGGLALTAPASAATDTTFFSISGDPTDWVTSGTSHSNLESDSTFTPDSTVGQAVISVSSNVPGPQSWTADFRAPSGQDLVAGTTYTDVQRSPFAVPPHAGLEVVSGQGCNAITGLFTVLQIERDPTSHAITRFAASFEQHCEGLAAASRGVIYYHSTLPYVGAASLSLNGAATLPVGASVSLTGTLSDGTNPIASAALSVARIDSGVTTALPTATTSAGGTYTVTDTMPSSAATYVVSFAGNGSVQPLAAVRTITIGAYPSTLTITAPTAGARGAAYHVSGVLSSTDGALAGKRLTVKRTDLAGSRMFTTTTTASGAYSVRDVPAVGGPVSWTFTWAGDVAHGPKVATRSVTIARAATAMTITVAKKAYAYLARAVVTVHLGTTYNGRTVYVYALAAGTTVKAPGVLIAHGRVNSKGNLVASIVMRRKTTFTAKFAGDYRYAPVARSVVSSVTTKIGLEAGGYSAKSGAYYVFASAQGAFRATFYPARTSGCVAWSAQRLYGSTWKNVPGLACGSSWSGTYEYVTFVNPTRGAKYRMRASVKANSYSLAGASGWLYFMFR